MPAWVPVGLARRGLERLDVLAEDRLRAPVLSLGVEALAEVPPRQRLERRVLDGAADAEAALAVLDRQLGLALEIVVVDEIGVHAREAAVVADLLRHRLCFLRELEHALELAKL